MNKKNIKWLILAVAAILVIVVVIFVWQSSKEPSELEEFAKCISDGGATFYGTFWCSHCQSQKEMFGEAKKYLPYVECSTPDGKGQTFICQNKNISGYPTWEFADGGRQSGEVSLKDLADKTGCTLPL